MKYDTIIIGAGSAGMSAAIYAARFNLSVLMLGQEVGGLLNESHCVENYPGFNKIPGIDLMMKFKEHVDSLKIETKNDWVSKIEACDSSNPKQRCFKVTAKDFSGNEIEYQGRTIVLATGAKHRHLGAPGEDNLSGKGVSYCATCDAAFYKDVPVAIVGGGDSAAIAGALVSEFASKVYVIVRTKEMRAEPINRVRLEKNQKVEILYETEAAEMLGEEKVSGVKLSKPFEGKDTLDVKGVFIEIGQLPQSELAEGLGVKLNDRKEIIINDKSETSIEGVYAAGDIGNREYKQALTGAAEGAIAAFGVYALLQKVDEEKDVNIGY
ncbi:FAD-dependent oxidoreductase [Candidatus Woesearchaeota archaeon]|nr:FAD-dependent oxidoreductase [Candidatus Woesearchaeota archaeon]